MKKIITFLIACIMLISILPTTAYADTNYADAFTASSAANVKTISLNTSENFYFMDNNGGGYQYKAFKISAATSQRFIEFCLEVASDNKEVILNIVDKVDFTNKTYNTICSKVVSTANWNNVITGIAEIPANTDAYVIIAEKDTKKPIYATDTENTLSVFSHNHAFVAKIENSIKSETCSKCGYKRVYQTLKNYSLSSTSYTYNGNVRNPLVVVKDNNGNTVSSSYYSISRYGNRKYVGKYKVVVTMKAYPYYGKKTLYYTIKPKGTSIKTISSKKKKTISLNWNKQSVQTTGYQIQYSTSSKFKNAKTKTIAKTSTNKCTISKLSSKKKYYVRMRTYKNVKINGKTQKIYSSWSKSKNIKTK